jgi:hypothetical protein
MSFPVSVLSRVGGVEVKIQLTQPAGAGTGAELGKKSNFRRPTKNQKSKTTKINPKIEDDQRKIQNSKNDQNNSKIEDDLNISPSILNPKPNPPILGLSTAQVMGFIYFILT